MGKLLVTCVLAAFLVSCSSWPPPPGQTAQAQQPEKPRDVVVLDDLKIIKAGGSFAMKLDPGMYKLEMTASGPGASIEWVGPPCPGASIGTKNFSTICELPSTGQVVFKNAGFFGLGSDTSVTIKMTKLPRDVG